jgi:hypothetical protein
MMRDEHGVSLTSLSAVAPCHSSVPQGGHGDTLCWLCMISLLTDAFVICVLSLCMAASCNQDGHVILGLVLGHADATQSLEPCCIPVD